MDINLSAKESIKNLRYQLFLNKTEFAELLGITTSAISHFELGKRKPSLHTIKKMMEIAKKKKIKLELKDFFDED